MEHKFRAWDKILECYTKNSMQLFHNEGIITFDAGTRYVFEQYTGLEDENGVKIYESDVVEAVGQEVVKITEGYRTMKSGIYNFVVFWSESFAGWEFKHSIGSIHPNVGIREYKIIGNIHQNPELLKEKEND